MFNQRLLKAKMVERGVTATALSNSIGICEATFYRKINRDGDFSRFEIQKISEVLLLSLEEKVNIFFAKQLT